MINITGKKHKNLYTILNSICVSEQLLNFAEDKCENLKFSELKWPTYFLNRI